MATEPTRKILELFSRLNSGNYSQNELNALIECSFSIAETYLGRIHKRTAKILSLAELSIQDVAIDAVADLFQINEESEKFVIQKSFLNWTPRIDSEAEALFFLNKVVEKKVEQYITSLLKYSDPFFEMIHRQLLYQIKKHGYTKSRYLGCVFVIESKDTIMSGKILTTDALQKYSSCFSENPANVLHSVFSRIKQEGVYFPAIPLNAFIYKIKEVRQCVTLKFDDGNEAPVMIELEECVNSGIQAVVRKIESSYLAKHKIDSFEADLLHLTIKDIARDLCEGGLGYELYEYLKIHLPNLSRLDYQLKYQNILEYLYKILRGTIAKAITDGTH